MTKILVSLLSLGLLASTAGAAQNGYTLSKTPRRTPEAAAKGAAAYTFNRAFKDGKYGNHNLKIIKTIDSRGNTQRFTIMSTNKFRTRTVTVKKVSGGWAGYLPNTKTKVRFGTNLR